MVVVALGMEVAEAVLEDSEVLLDNLVVWYDNYSGRWWSGGARYYLWGYCGRIRQ